MYPSAGFSLSHILFLLLVAFTAVLAAPVAQPPAQDTDVGYRAVPEDTPASVTQPLQRCREWLDVPFDTYSLSQDRYCMCITDVPDSKEPERTVWQHDPAFYSTSPAGDPCTVLGAYIGTIVDGKLVAA